jgi:hypothetical protein
MPETQLPRLDPLADPDHLVSFPRVEKLLADMFAALAPQMQTDFAAERDLVVGFLHMFPAGFITHVPYPLNQPGEYFFQITQPPPRWP